MIIFINGILEQILDHAAIVDVGGVGYLAVISPGTAAKLPRLGENVKIYTHMHAKEDGTTLYGFMSMDELNMFNRLITVSGVGPKAAQGLLSVLSPPDVMLAIVSDDLAALSKGPGVGKKTAQRIILELKDKVRTDDVSAAALDNQQSITHASGVKQDAIDALTALGYGRSEAVRCVLEVALEGMTTAQIIKLALRKLSS